MHTKPIPSPASPSPQKIIRAQAQAGTKEQLAAEGYQFYAQESLDFAAASVPAVAQATIAQAQLLGV